METEHFDANGRRIHEGDILQSTNDPARRGAVVRSGDLYVIACGDEGQLLTYHIDDAHEWRIVGNVRNSSQPEE